MENADYCDDIKSIIMWMLQKESANRPTAKQVQEAISSHKCKNIGTHTAVELSKAVAKGTYIYTLFGLYITILFPSFRN